MFVQINETITVNTKFVTDVVAFKNNNSQKWDVLIRLHNHGDVRYRVGNFQTKEEAEKRLAEVQKLLVEAERQDCFQVREQKDDINVVIESPIQTANS